MCLTVYCKNITLFEAINVVNVKCLEDPLDTLDNDIVLESWTILSVVEKNQLKNQSNSTRT